MAAMVTVIQNFPAKHRAKVVALLDTMYGSGIMVFATIYTQFFVNGHVQDEQNQNLKGYILFLLITVSATSLLCVMFLRVFPLEEPPLVDKSSDPPPPFLVPMQPVRRPSGSRSLMSDFDDASSDAFGANTKSTQTLRPRMREAPQKQSSYIKSHFLLTFLSLDFQCLLWSFVLITSTTVMFMNNLTAMTKSVGLSRYNWLLTIVFSIVGIVSRFVFSPLSDLTYPRVPRVFFLVMGHSFSLASFIAMSMMADERNVFFSASACIGIAISLDYTFTMTALSEDFGTDHFGLHFGVFKLFDAAAGFSTNRAFGAIYDGQIQNRTSGQTDCYGKHCSQGSMILAAILSLCAVVCAIGYILKTCSSKRTS